MLKVKNELLEKIEELKTRLMNKFIYVEGPRLLARFPCNQN